LLLFNINSGIKALSQCGSTDGIRLANPGHQMLGAIEIPHRKYLQRLSAAVKMKCSF